MSQLFTKQASVLRRSASPIKSGSYMAMLRATSLRKRSMLQSVTVRHGLAGESPGTIELLPRSLHSVGIILVGEPDWRQLPPTEDVAKGCLAKDVRAQLTSEPERYAAYTREYLGWGVFVLMLR